MLLCGNGMLSGLEHFIYIIAESSDAEQELVTGGRAIAPCCTSLKLAEPGHEISCLKSETHRLLQ